MYDLMFEKIRVIFKNIYWDLFKNRIKKMTAVEMPLQYKGISVISRNEYVGLFSYVETCMRQVVLSLKNGYYPVVDMTGCDNPYLEDGNQFDTNWWELYFKQPIKYDEDYSADRLPRVPFETVTKMNFEEVKYGRSAILLKHSRWYWGDIYSRFFCLNEKTEQYFEDEYKKIMHNGCFKVLGVLIRGTDYKSAQGHPIQPDFSVIARNVKTIFNRGRYDKIYLASDEHINVERMNLLFPGKVLTNNRKYYDGIDMTGKTINHIRFERKDDRYLCGLEYLSSIMLLSKCNGLVAGICGGSIAAVYINNNKYSDLKLIYKGLTK